MAKTKTTSQNFYIVDLVRNKPATQYIKIPTYRVDVEIDVTTKGLLSAAEVPSSAMKRLELAAREALDNYEQVISKEAARLDAKIVELMATPTAKAQSEAEALTQGVNQSIKNALASAEGAAQKAVAERLKKEAQGDKNLKEAHARTAIKWTLGAISLAASVASLVGSMGANVTAYVSIAKTVVTLGLDLNQQLKNEAKLNKDLVDGIQAFITLRGTVIKQAISRQGLTDFSGIDITKPVDAIKTIAGKVEKAGVAGVEIAKGRDAKGIATEVFDFVVKGINAKLNDAESARKAYREHTTKTRHKTDALSTKADELTKAMKAAKNLNEGVKIGAACMQIKQRVSAMAKKLEDRERFLDTMQELMKGNGLVIDDRTTLQKLAELDKMTLLSEATDLLSAVNTVKGLVTELASLI